MRFTTTIEPYGPAAAIMLTDEQAASLSSAKTPPVIVTVEERSARLRVTERLDHIRYVLHRNRYSGDLSCL